MPRLWCPGGSKCSTAASAAASMTLIITGVANTAMRPEPTRGAVCSGPTTISAVPVRPGRTADRSSIRTHTWVRARRFTLARHAHPPAGPLRTLDGLSGLACRILAITFGLALCRLGGVANHLLDGRPTLTRLALSPLDGLAGCPFLGLLGLAFC